jgi:hypothetical protein
MFSVKVWNETRPDENLIEDVPVIRHVLMTLILVGSGRILSTVSEVTPHRVIEIEVLSLLDSSELFQRLRAKHRCVEPHSTDYPFLERIHVHVSHQHSPRMPDAVLCGTDVSCQLSALLCLAVFRPKQLLGK